MKSAANSKAARARLTVRETAAGKWAVAIGNVIFAEFPTNREAWRWLDRHERRLLCIRRQTADWTGEGVYYDTTRSEL